MAIRKKRHIVITFDTPENAKNALMRIKQEFMKGVPAFDDVSHTDGVKVIIKNRSTFTDREIKNFGLNLNGACWANS